MSFRFADHRLIHSKLLGLSEQTNDAYAKMTMRLAALAIQSLAQEVDSMRGTLPVSDHKPGNLASHVYRAGEVLYLHDLLDAKHLRFDLLVHAALALRDLNKRDDEPHE